MKVDSLKLLNYISYKISSSINEKELTYIFKKVKYKISNSTM